MTKSVKIHKRTKGWKRHQSDSKTRNKVVLGILALVLVVGIVLIGRLINLVGDFTRPELQNSPYARFSSWNGSSNLNLIIKSDQGLDFVALKAEDNSLTVVKIPDQTHLNVGLGFGSWQAGSIYELGQSEKSKIGGPLLKIALANTLGVPIDGYIVFDPESSQSTSDLIESLRSNPTKIFGAIHQGSSDLSSMEEFQFWWKVSGIRFDKVTNLDLSQLPATKWVLLSDGSRVLQIDQQVLDQSLLAYTEEGILVDERVNIAVFNSTSHPQLAEKVARVISNMGGRVVLTSSLNIPQNKTLILGDQKTNTYKRLQQIFSPRCKSQTLLFVTLDDGCAKISSQLIADNESVKQGLERAELLIIVGEDYYNRFTDKPSR